MYLSVFTFMRTLTIHTHAYTHIQSYNKAAKYPHGIVH